MLEYLKTAFTEIDINFVVELIVACGLFLWRAPRRNYFPLRIISALTFCLLLSILWKRPDMSTSSVISIFRYITIFAATLAASFFCFKITVIETLSYGTGAYAIQHCAYSVKLLISSAAALATNDEAVLNFLFGDGFEAVVFIPVYAAMYFIFVRRIFRGKLDVRRIPLLVTSLLLVLASMIINLYWFIGWKIDPVNELYPIVCCIIALFFLAGLFENSRLKYENQMVKYMLNLKNEHGELSKENINIINTKCHDMKHQLTALLSSRGELGEFAEEVEKSINIYESIAKTGNEALDVIITEKSLQCEGNGIKFTYMADGGMLSFMSATDIYSLFGNALDNAIESVKKVSAPEKRIIGMTLSSNGGVYTVHFENYYEHELNVVDGIPQTTKADADYHGFGMKSIALIAEKYNGSMSVVANGGVFNLNVILSPKITS